MAKPIARKIDAHKSDGESISFTRDSETGLFRKVEQKFSFNHLDYSTKKVGKPIVSECYYEITDEENHEYSFDVSSPSGKNVKIYLKEVKD